MSQSIGLGGDIRELLEQDYEDWNSTEEAVHLAVLVKLGGIKQLVTSDVANTNKSQSIEVGGDIKELLEQDYKDWNSTEEAVDLAFLSKVRRICHWSLD